MRTIMAYRYEVKDHTGAGTGRYMDLRLERDETGWLRVLSAACDRQDLAEILDSGVMAELEAAV